MKHALAAGIVAVIALLGAAAVAAPAQAHSELVSSDPVDGAVLDALPTTVSFTFNEPLMPDFVRFIGTDPSGNTGDLPVSGVEGPTATIAWPASAPGGEWTVSYRVVSQDGHPIEGGITFSYAGASPTASPTSPAPTSAEPTSAAPTSAAPTSAEATSAVTSPSTSPAADTSGGTSGLLIAGVAVGVIVIAGVVIALVARRRA